MCVELTLEPLPIPISARLPASIRFHALEHQEFQHVTRDQSS